jgi:hypothetical protein
VDVRAYHNTERYLRFCHGCMLPIEIKNLRGNMQLSRSVPLLLVTGSGRKCTCTCFRESSPDINSWAAMLCGFYVSVFVTWASISQRSIALTFQCGLILKLSVIPSWLFSLIVIDALFIRTAKKDALPNRFLLKQKKEHPKVQKQFDL